MTEFPAYRGRRLRRTDNLRRLARETGYGSQHLILPLFVIEGEKVRRSIGSMPGVDQTSIDELLRDCEEANELGLGGVLLFGIPSTKDETGSSGYDPEGVVQRAVREIKARTPDLVVITDVCLCEYTTHGHCGLIEAGDVDNDRTLPYLARMAVSHAEAGADIVAPSDMMDGRIRSIREGLDGSGYESTAIMSYSAKYASSFYGPFRDAAESTPQFGDRRGYQMDPANGEEGVREALMDIAEGADLLIVKPALSYLDVIYRVKQATGYPIVGYHVSGEYSMIAAAAERGWIDGDRALEEATLSIRRAGADLVITYAARDLAKRLSP